VSDSDRERDYETRSRAWRNPCDDWETVGWVLLVAFLAICVGCGIARLAGYGVADSEVVCSKGGEAYLPMLTHIYRIPNKDAVCKKVDSK
jgi:hypothetical protein